MTRFARVASMLPLTAISMSMFGITGLQVTMRIRRSPTYPRFSTISKVGKFGSSGAVKSAKKAS